MASIDELEDKIRECEKEIEEIEEDIKGMEKGKQSMGLIHADFHDIKEYVEPYDISGGDMWRGNLYTEAVDEQKCVSEGVESAKESCKTTIKELDDCITKAKEMIEDLKERIRHYKDEIEEILSAQACDEGTGESS